MGFNRKKKKKGVKAPDSSSKFHCRLRGLQFLECSSFHDMHCLCLLLAATSWGKVKEIRPRCIIPMLRLRIALRGHPVFCLLYPPSCQGVPDSLFRPFMLPGAVHEDGNREGDCASSVCLHIVQAATPRNGWFKLLYLLRFRIGFSPAFFPGMPELPLLQSLLHGQARTRITLCSMLVWGQSYDGW